MNFLPKITFGKWSVTLFIFFIIFFAVLLLFVASGERGGAVFFSNLKLAISGLLAAVSAILSFFIGFIAVILQKERSILVTYLFFQVNNKFLIYCFGSLAFANSFLRLIPMIRSYYFLLTTGILTIEDEVVMGNLWYQMSGIKALIYLPSIISIIVSVICLRYILKGSFGIKGANLAANETAHFLNEKVERQPENPAFPVAEICCLVLCAW